MQLVRRRRRRRARRERGVLPGHRVRRVEGPASSKRSSKLADDDFSPVYLRNATAYGVSRRLRADIVVNNLVGHAVTTGKVLLQSDGTPWRPLVHIARHHRTRSGRASTAPREAIHNQAFNVGRTARTTASAMSPTSLPRSCRTARWRLPPGASPDTRDYRVDFRKIDTKLPGFAAAVDAAQRHRGAVRGLQSAGAHQRAVPGPRYYRLRTVKGLQERVCSTTSSGALRSKG